MSTTQPGPRIALGQGPDMDQELHQAVRSAVIGGALGEEVRFSTGTTMWSVTSGPFGTVQEPVHIVVLSIRSGLLEGRRWLTGYGLISIPADQNELAQLIHNTMTQLRSTRDGLQA